MTALTVGVTTARFPECKRGIAANLAASLARDSARPRRVCVVDADPLTLDVSTRFAVRGPSVEDYAERDAPASETLGAVHEPPLWVLPSAGAGVGFTSRAADLALRRLRSDFDVVICDLVGSWVPATPSMPACVGRLGQLDWLVVAVTPDVEPVEATARFLGALDQARTRGDLADSLRFAVVTTGDESTTDLSPDVVARALRRPVIGSVPQLWGRAAPNLGFGAALGIAELDDAVAALFDRLGARGASSPATSRAS